MKKIITQLFLVIIILISTVTLQQKFFTKETPELSKDDYNEESIDSKDDNIIKNLTYTAKDIEGNKYTIKSKHASYSSNETGEIIMTDVLATIVLINSEDININSKSAYYNSISHNTSFSDGVSITYSGHNINSDNLDLIFEKKLAYIFNNVIYKNLNTIVKADKIEFDLVAKNSKISMYEKLDNIKIINKK